VTEPLGDDLDYDVFISYTGADRAFAVELDDCLGKLGIRAFFDRRVLTPGRPWIVGLERAIERSRAVAILIGCHGLGNVQQYERDLAVVRQSSDPKFPIIPVLIPGCQSPPGGFLALWTWIDLRDGLRVDGVRERLQTALDQRNSARAFSPEPICPFMGLEPFREEDGALFCGREKTVARTRGAIAKLSRFGFIAVSFRVPADADGIRRTPASSKSDTL